MNTKVVFNFKMPPYFDYAQQPSQSFYKWLLSLVEVLSYREIKILTTQRLFKHLILASLTCSLAAKVFFAAVLIIISAF